MGWRSGTHLNFQIGYQTENAALRCLKVALLNPHSKSPFSNSSKLTAKEIGRLGSVLDDVNFFFCG